MKIMILFHRYRSRMLSVPFSNTCSILRALSKWVSLIAVVSAGQFGIGSELVYCQQAPGYHSPDDQAPAYQTDPGEPERLPSNSQQAPRDSEQPRVYVDNGGTVSRARSSDYRLFDSAFAPDPITDLQRLARLSTGALLPIFGRDLFQRPPSTFAPSNQISGFSNYIIGPGDQLIVRIWGPETFNSQLTVDPTGAIYIPKVGAIYVSGLRFDEVEKHVGAEVGKIYRNYQLAISLGQLRSIQVYVVGEARRPGLYTISSLSTILNALFVSGGPNADGSLRRIQLRRAGETLSNFDLYDFVIRGDRSQDSRLQSGDTIFIPSVGPQVALGGSVRHPAIFELNHETTVEDVLALAGGFSSVANKTAISLERIQPNQSRHATTVNLDPSGLKLVLKDGDVIFANHITAGYEDSVTIRGNLANPGRFAWHQGMRLSEIIPESRALLTNDYWRERDKLGIPVPLFQPLQNYSSNSGRDNNRLNAPGAPFQALQSQSPSAYGRDQDDGSATAQQNYGYSTQQQTMGAEEGTAVSGRQNASAVAERSDSDLAPLSATTVATPGENPSAADSKVKNTINVPPTEIDWSYAVIERIDPITLKSSLLPFNLGKLVLDHDPKEDLELHAGDVVTILSQDDVLTARDTQTKYIRIEGEFVSSGVYSVGPNETLQEVVARAGGLTSKAYLYGSSLIRKSAQVFQQQRLDEYIATLSAEMDRQSAVRAASAPSGVLDLNAISGQRALVSQLKALRATGRVVLGMFPESSGIESVPPIPLEDGDVFRVPPRPNMVSVVGAVYGPNIYLFDSRKRLRDYVTLAGDPNRIADMRHSFVIRADGSIYSRDRARKGPWDEFDSVRINPGDSIVIPERPIKPTLTRQLLDYSQVLAGFGLAAAAINVVR
jgi:protein involved in polysaccharide export with SLBB domain